MSETILNCRASKSFDGTLVLKGVSLQRSGGVYHPAGVLGLRETTTLRIIAGLEAPDQGRVLLEGEGDMTDVEPNRRDVNTVFQSYAPVLATNVGAERGLRPEDPEAAQERDQRRSEKCWNWSSCPVFESASPPSFPAGRSSGVAIARSSSTGPRSCLDEPGGPGLASCAARCSRS